MQKIDIDMNDIESVQKGIHFYQVRAIISVICYPILLYVLYGLWTHKNEFLDDSTREMIANSPVSYMLLGYMMGEPLIRLLFRLIKIMRLKNRLAELQEKAPVKNQLSRLNLLDSFKKKLFPEQVCHEPDTPESLQKSIGISYVLGITIVIIGLIVLCLLFMEGFSSDIMELYVIDFVFLGIGIYLVLLEPRRLERKLYNLKKLGKFYSDR